MHVRKRGVESFEELSREGKKKKNMSMEKKEIKGKKEKERKEEVAIML